MKMGMNVDIGIGKMDTIPENMCRVGRSDHIICGIKPVTLETHGALSKEHGTWL